MQAPAPTERPVITLCSVGMAGAAVIWGAIGAPDGTSLGCCKTHSQNPTISGVCIDVTLRLYKDRCNYDPDGFPCKQARPEVTSSLFMLGVALTLPGLNTDVFAGAGIDMGGIACGIGHA